MKYNKKIIYTNLPTKEVAFNAFPGTVNTPQFKILTEHILKHGILSPLTCIVTESSVLCKSGNQRLYVAKENNIKEIPCICIVLERHMNNDNIRNRYNGEIIESYQNVIYKYHKPISLVEDINYINSISSSYHLEGYNDYLKDCPSNPFKMRSRYFDRLNKKIYLYDIIGNKHVLNKVVDSKH